MDKLLLTIVILFIPSLLVSQTNSTGYENHFVHSLTTKDGLSQSNVNTIVQDSTGYIWIGTDEGLNRFDGYNFKVFKKSDKDSTSISNNVINSLFVDRYDRIWIGTAHGGLNLYDPYKENFRRIHLISKDYFRQNVIYDIKEDSLGRLWIASYKGIIVLTVSDLRQDNTPPAQIIGEQTFCLEIDGETVWAGTRNGISKINLDLTFDEDFEIPSVLANAHNSEVLDIEKDPEGNIWFASHDAGILKWDKTSGEFLSYPIPESSTIIRQIKAVDNGNIIAGSDGDGLYLLKKGNKKFHSIQSFSDPSLNKASIYALYKRDKTLWVGTYAIGLKAINLNTKGFNHIRNFNITMKELGKNSILKMVEDSLGNIWIGTDGAGLYYYNVTDKSFKHYYHVHGQSNTISGNVIKSIIIDEKGNLYAGTFNAGLNYIDLKTNQVTTFLHSPDKPNSINSNNVWDLYQDSENRIWVATLGGGLDEFHPEEKKFTHHMTKPEDTTSISSDYLSVLFEDSKGNLWVGSEGGGLNLYHKEQNIFSRFIRSEAETGISSNDIRDIYEDNEGQLWVATNGGGLNLYDYQSKTFTPKFEKLSLSKSLQGVLEDEEGHFWISSYEGLFKLNPKTEQLIPFNSSDGIQSDEFNYNSKLKSSTGVFYFGGKNGLTYFTPKSITQSDYKPSIVLSDLFLFHSLVEINNDNGIIDQSLNLMEELVLNHNQNFISIEYAALEHSYPKKNQYAYQLEGFDEEWNFVQDKRTATYTNLAPGDYVFNVKTTNGDGIWSDKIKSLKIIVLPPWYQSNWWYALLTLCGVTVVVMVIRFRTKMLENKKRNLEIQIKRRTRLISEQKAEIENKNRSLKNQNKRIQESHYKIMRQNEELKNKNSEINSQQLLIKEKSHELEQAHHNLKNKNEQLKKINNNLEDSIEERTSQLKDTMNKLIKTDEGLNTFIYRSSHDLRGPITTLRGLAQLAKKENQDKELDSFFDKIDHSSKRMLRFLKKLGETNTVFKTENKEELISWNQLISDIRHELKDLVESKNAMLNFDIKLKNDVYTDGNLLKNILLNLIENSIIYNVSKVPSVNATIDLIKNKLHIEVLDNGIGINKEIQDKVFDMFYRGSELSIGNGLGLFMVKKAVENLEGEITWDSKEREFSEFRIKIPVRKASDKRMNNKISMNEDSIQKNQNGKPLLNRKPNTKRI